jgi:hypothetical protein
MRRAISEPEIDDMAEQMAALGLVGEPPATVRQEIEILPDMVDSLRLFAALGTQWRVGPGGGVLGLDYGAMRDVAGWLEVMPTPRIFDDLRRLEAGVLAAMSRP